MCIRDRSKGPMKGNIPNVVGLTLGEAGNILKENKLSLGNIKYEYSDTYNNGIVDVYKRQLLYIY